MTNEPNERSDGTPAASGVDEDTPAPRIPRRAGFKLSLDAVVRIALTAALLAMIVVARRPCADSVSKFVVDMDTSGSGSAARRMPRPGTVDVPSATGSAGDYETLRSDMSEAEIRAAIERARAKSRGGGAPPAVAPAPGSATGSAAPRANGDGSAAPTPH